MEVCLLFNAHTSNCTCQGRREFVLSVSVPSRYSLLPTFEQKGMSVLRKINPKVQRAVADASLPLTLISSRTKPWFRIGIPNKEHTGDYTTLLTIPIENAIREAGGKVTEELLVGSEIMAYTIMRGALQVCGCAWVLECPSPCPRACLRRCKYKGYISSHFLREFAASSPNRA